MTVTTQTQTGTVLRVRGGALLDALAALRPFVAAGRTAADHACGVQLVADAQVCEVRCSTGEVSARAPFDADVDQPVAVWVRLADLWSAASAYSARRGKKSQEPLTVTVGDERVIVAAENGQTGVRVLDADVAVPAMPEIPGTLVVDRERFAHDCRVAKECASDDQMIPILTAARISDGVIHATDRYRLAHLEIRGTGSLPQTQPPAATLAKALAATSGQTVSLGADGEHLSIHADNLTATLRCVPGEYPKVAGILEQDGSVQVTTDRAALLEAVKPHAAAGVLVALVMRGRDLAVEILTSTDDEPVATATLTPAAETEATLGDTPLFMDSRYLTAALKALVDEQVHLSTPGTLRPVRFESPTDPDRVVIVQPIRRAL